MQAVRRNNESNNFFIYKITKKYLNLLSLAKGEEVTTDKHTI